MWKQLLSYVVPSPWLVGGDFNTVFGMDDKLGSKDLKYYADLIDGMNWLKDSFLEEVRCVGLRYSWSNRQVGTNRVYSKIDWLFYNECWVDAYNDSFFLS